MRYWSPSMEPICCCHSKRNSNKFKNIINRSSFDTRYRRGFEIAFFSSFKKQFKVVFVRTGLLSSKKKTGNFFFRKDKKLFKMFPLYISLNAKNINLFWGFSISQNHHHNSAKTNSLLCRSCLQKLETNQIYKRKKILLTCKLLFCYCTYHF